MVRRTALVLLGLLVTAAAGIFAADHLGVDWPWDVASMTAPEQASKKESEKSPAPEESPTAATESAIEDTVAALVGDAPESAEPRGSVVALDISRISPDGPSVFAGRAKPGAYVTVFADGKPAGTVQADDGGSWSLSTEHKFASTDPNITFEAAATPPAEPAPEPEPARAAAETAPATETAPPQETETASGNAAEDASAPEVAGDVMRKFEELVSEAREDAAREKAAEEDAERKREAERKEAEREREVAERKEKETAGQEEKVAERETVAAAATRSSAPSSEAPAPSGTATSGTGTEARDEDKASEAKASASADARPGATSTVGADQAQKKAETDTAMLAAPGKSAKPEAQAPIPVPLMFVYNQATLTPEGERAADLLLEYLLLKRLDSIELTGHADERGTHNYNFELSRERLETVARILKDGGYKGDLKLTPKGKTEPFKGVDRTRYRGEALYQFDRRVELRVTR